MKCSEIVMYWLEIVCMLSYCQRLTVAKPSNGTTNCSVQYSNAGDKATLTCHFPYPVANKTVQVAHRSLRNSNKTIVRLDCFPQSGDYRCHKDPAYELQSNLTDIVKLIFVASPDTEGVYSCYIMPATEHLYQECYFDRQISPTDVSRKTLSTEVILGITASLAALALLICALTIICYRRRCLSPPRKACCKPCTLSCCKISHETRRHKITETRVQISDHNTGNSVGAVGYALNCFCCSCTRPSWTEELDGSLPPSASCLEFGNSTPLSLADLDIHAILVGRTDENDNLQRIPSDSGIFEPIRDVQS